ncbi:hypothetical protein HDZ31DRAFT_51458, partial [Schizophyllum fasciatum]
MTEPTLTSADAAPDVVFTVLDRVYGIPLVAATLDKIHETLTTNALTKRPYAAARGLSAAAYESWQPVQTRLAPLITRVDGLANKVFDIVEARFPYPIHVKPEDVSSAARERRKSLVDSAHQTFDERVKLPAFHVAEGIDKRLAPIVDFVEAQVAPRVEKSAAKAHANGNAALEETKYQYERALALSKALTERIASLPSEQFSKLQEKSPFA